MTKQGLLIKLAKECATWEEAVKLGMKIEFECLIGGKAFNVDSLLEHEWLAEREWLLNKPSWDDAPTDAKLLALDSNLFWYWHLFQPSLDEQEHVANGPLYCAGMAIAIPAGYDWRDSLEERPV